jgi:membrane-bound serine protease (ClpP class)
MSKRNGRTVCAAMVVALAAGLWADSATTKTPPPGGWATEDGWFAARKRLHPAPELPASIIQAFVIPIHGPISETTYEATRRKVIECRSKGAELVIFDMKTPGGRGDSMRKIVRLLLEDLEDVYRVAYVNSEAYSAGAIISLACHEIVMTKRAVIGDAMPILIGPQGNLMPIPKEERAKIESPILAEVRSLADENGYSQALCEGMVTVKIEVWLIRNRETGELRAVDVDAGGWRKNVREAPDREDEEEPDTPWEFVHRIDPDDKLVTMNTEEAKRYGFVRHVFDTRAELERHYHVATPAVLLSDTWSEELVAWLTSPAITGVLIGLGILALYAELHTPGVGLAGAVALVCFSIVFGSRFLIGLAAWWEIAVFVTGLILLALELFVIPGFGVAGVLGIIGCVVGLLAMFVSNAPDRLPIPSSTLGWEVFTESLFALACAIALAAVGAVVLASYLPKIPVANRLMLSPLETPDEAPVTPDSPMRRIEIGDTGVVEGMCRPVGKVRFGDSLLDATSEGEMIASGATVRVLRRNGNRLVVEPVKET